MKVECTSSHELTASDLGAVLASCWPDFEVDYFDIEIVDITGTAWRVPVPPPLASAITNGQQESKWQNSATIPIAGQPITVTLTFDPGTATED